MTVTQIAGFVIFYLPAEKQDLPRHDRSTRNYLCNGCWPEVHKKFVKIEIEIVIRNSPQKVFEAECVFGIVDRLSLRLLHESNNWLNMPTSSVLFTISRKLKTRKKKTWQCRTWNWQLPSLIEIFRALTACNLFSKFGFYCKTSPKMQVQQSKLSSF